MDLKEFASLARAFRMRLRSEIFRINTEIALEFVAKMRNRIFNDGLDSNMRNLGAYRSRYWRIVRFGTGNQVNNKDLNWSGNMFQNFGYGISNGKILIGFSGAMYSSNYGRRIRQAYRQGRGQARRKFNVNTNRRQTTSFRPVQIAKVAEYQESRLNTIIFNLSNTERRELIERYNKKVLALFEKIF